MIVVFSTMTAVPVLFIVSTTYRASLIGKEITMLNIRTFTLTVVLAAIFILMVGFKAAGMDKVTHAASNPASVSEIQERPESLSGTYRAASYRSQFGECVDVPIKDLAGCRNASRAAIQTQKSAVDECFDVSLWEAASCRKANESAVP